AALGSHRLGSHVLVLEPAGDRDVAVRVSIRHQPAVEIPTSRRMGAAPCAADARHLLDSSAVAGAASTCRFVRVGTASGSRHPGNGAGGVLAVRRVDGIVGIAALRASQRSLKARYLYSISLPR